MNNRNYNPTAAGRQSYTAANGVLLERKWVYGTANEWQDMQSLANTFGIPLGKMLFSLAYKEIERIRQQQSTPYASNR